MPTTAGTGVSIENAVKTQVWIAVSVYVLVAIIRKRLKIEASLYTIAINPSGYGNDNDQSRDMNPLVIV